MAVVTLGPLAFASERLAAIVGIFVFLGLGSWMARRYDKRLAHWTTSAVLAGLISARALHVLMHLDSFLTEPWRALYVWQGGFSMIGGAIGVAITLVFLMRESRQTLPFAIAPLVSGVFAWFALTVLWQEAEGPAAPSFTLARFDGSQSVALAERNGRPAVVNLWATWCPPCRREMPLMADVAAARMNIDFIFANQGEGPATIQAYLDDQNLRLETILLDPALSLSRHYAAPGMPVTLFLGNDGQVVTTHFGEISREALNAAIARLIPADKE